MMSPSQMDMTFEPMSRLDSWLLPPPHCLPSLPTTALVQAAVTSAFLLGPLVSICASFWQHSSAPDPSCWSPTVSKTGGKLPSPPTQPLLTPQCQQCAPSGPHASASLERGPAKSVPAPLLMPLGWRLAGAVLLTYPIAPPLL